MKISLDFTGKTVIQNNSDGSVTISIPMKISRYSGRKQIVVPKSIAPQGSFDARATPMQIALAKGYLWKSMLESGHVQSIRQLAKREKVDNSHIGKMINMTTLSPQIVQGILDETLPPEITLFDLAQNTPVSWDEQLKMLESAPH
ncbi:MAG: LacI family transcriptional regulator [Limnohabitans sp.]